VSPPTIHEVHEIPPNSVYPITHGEMNISTPSTIWTASPYTIPGTANDANPSSVTNAPRMIIVHIAASFVSIHRNDSSATSPRTPSAQSYGLVHGRTAVTLAISPTSMFRSPTPPIVRLVGRPVKNPSSHLPTHLSTDPPPIHTPAPFDHPNPSPQLE